MSKKALISLLCCVIAVVYLVATISLDHFTTKSISFAPALGHELGLLIEDAQVEVSKISGMRSIAWRGISAKTKIVSANTVSTPGATYYLTADFVGITFLSFSKLLIEAEGVRIDPVLGDLKEAKLADVKLAEEPVQGRVAISNLQFLVELDALFSPKKEIKKLVDELRRLLTIGKTSLGMTLQGNLTVILGEKSRMARIITDTDRDDWVFKLSKDDLHNISFYFDEPLKDQEISLLASHPFRAAKLLEIRDYVRARCREEKEKDFRYPVDALRQVLWSYLLSVEFGVDFSKKVLESSKISTRTGKAASAMDYNNQRVGREWGQSGVTKEEIVEKVMHSPEVIRILVEG